MAERTDLPKRGMFGGIRSITYSGDYFLFRQSSDLSFKIPVLGGIAVAVDDLLNEQVTLLKAILHEEKKSVLHLAEGSDVDIEDAEEDEG